jgi:phosphoenolpyruvate carboxykinase (ATP)
VPEEILMPRNTWEDKEIYEKKAKELAEEFKEKFKKYEPFVSNEVKMAGPLV